jgi:hypothetical protein
VGGYGICNAMNKGIKENSYWRYTVLNSGMNSRFESPETIHSFKREGIIYFDGINVIKENSFILKKSLQKY